MATFTTRLGLKKPAGVDDVLVADLNTNMDILDAAAFGVIFCTAGTRPSSPTYGMHIYETDTGNRYGRNAANTAWVPLGMLRVADATARTALVSPVDGLPIYRQDRDWVEVYDGAAWRVQGVAVCTSVADRDAIITSPYNGQMATTTDTGTAWLRQAGVWTNASPPLVAVKSADQTVNSNTTYQNDTHMFVPLLASTSYQFELRILMVSGATPGFKSQFTYPAGTTGSVWGTNAGGVVGVTALPGALNWGATGADRYLTLNGRVLTSTTAGTFRFQWAQDVSNAANTTVRIGSFLRLSPVG